MKMCKKGGITLELSLVLPLFLFFFLMLFSVFDMISIHAQMDSALQQVGREMSAYVYAFEGYGNLIKEEGNSIDVATFINSETDDESKEDGMADFLQDMFLKEGYVKGRVISIVGKERIVNSAIIGGINGITLFRSDLLEDNDILDLTMTYRVRPWFSFEGIGEMTLVNRCYVHAYTGYEPNVKETSDKRFYITDNAEVYHTNRECTHLRLTISQVSEEELVHARNLYGGKYTECEICYEEAWT